MAKRDQPKIIAAGGLGMLDVPSKKGEGDGAVLETAPEQKRDAESVWKPSSGARSGFSSFPFIVIRPG